MKKIAYTILSICAIIYIGFLIVNVFIQKAGWAPDMGGFQGVFDFIVSFGGVAIIFTFALVNFAGSPLKVAFFIILIFVILIYIIVLACPNQIFDLFK